MTRILHVLDHSLPMHSGYTFRTRAIMTAQVAAGLDVRGITGPRHATKGPSAEAVDGLLFHRTSERPGGPAGLREWREIGLHADAIEQVCAQWRPDILHAHSPALCGQAALRAGQRLSIPVVYEIRAFWEDAAVGNGTGREGSLKYRLTRQLENNVIRRAGAIVTICEGLRTDLGHRGFDSSRITVMPNGVDLTLFGEPASRDSALATELGLPETERAGPVLGFIGSFYDYEGLDDLIAAIPALQARHPGVSLLLVGGGPREESLREQAGESSAAAAIHFAGRVPHEQVERYYSLMDVMVYPRKNSRLTDLVTPLKPLEAMAQGKLVAASDVGGHRELVRDGETGCLFPPDDPAKCAKVISDLLDHRDSWDDFRRNGRQFVVSHHDWARNALRYQDVYQGLLGLGANRGRQTAA